MRFHRFAGDAVLFAALVASTGAVAGPDLVSGCTIRGTVRTGDDSHADAGRAVALVRAGEPPRTATADPWGRFTFDGLPAGAAFELRIEAAGCATERLPGITLLPGERREVGVIELGPPARLDVRVLDETGRPAADATVRIFREPRGRLAEALERARAGIPAVALESKTTDPSGHATFDVPRDASWTVLARSPGHAVVARDTVRGATLELQLSRAERLTGRVLDAVGRPVPGAWVAAHLPVVRLGWCASCWAPVCNSALWLRADTDAAGVYVLDGLPPQAVRLIAAPPGGSPSSAGIVDASALHEFDVTLAPVGTLRGRVTDEDTGRPVEGAVVAAESGGLSQVAVSAADGRFQIDGLESGPEVDARILPPDGWAGGRDALSARVALRPGETAERDFRLRRAATVKGLVTRDGAPVANAVVDVVTLPTLLDGWVPACSTGRSAADGRFEIDDVLPGRVAVNANGPGDDASAAYDLFVKEVVRDAAGRARAAFDVAPGATVTHDVAIGAVPVDRTKQELRERMDAEMLGAFRTVRVHGRVTAADGLPLSCARVGTCAAGFDGEGDAIALGRPVAPDGTYSIEGSYFADDGRITVCAADERHAPAYAKDVQVGAATTEIVVDLVLPAFPVLRGRVLSDGAPVAGVTILADSLAVARTDDTGAFAARVGPGEVVVRAQARGFATKRLDRFEVPREEPLEIVLERARSIEGRVVDGEGAPVAGVVVLPQPEGDAEAPAAALTGTDGRFRVDGLAPCAWRLRVESTPHLAEGIATLTTEPIEAGANDVRIVVAPPCRITGRVTGAGARPLARVEVVCEPGPGDDEKAETRTDEAGRFAFEGLGAGDYTVRVDPSERSGLSPIRRSVRTPCAELVFELKDAPAICGVLVTDKGEPIADESVQAACLDWPQDLPRPRNAPETKTDASGAFRIVVPVGTRFRLIAGTAVGLRARAVILGGDDVAAGATEVRLVAAPGAPISGVVVDPEGKPLAGAQVTARVRDDTRTVTSKEDGRFELPDVVTPEVTLTVQCKGRVDARLEHVAAGRSDVRIVLAAGQSITGRLLDASGAPATGWLVRAVSPAFPATDRWRGTPDAAGRFEITALADVEWYLEAIQEADGRIVGRAGLGKAKAGARDLELQIGK